MWKASVPMLRETINHCPISMRGRRHTKIEVKYKQDKLLRIPCYLLQKDKLDGSKFFSVREMKTSDWKRVRCKSVQKVFTQAAACALNFTLNDSTRKAFHIRVANSHRNRIARLPNYANPEQVHVDSAWRPHALRITGWCGDRLVGAMGSGRVRGGGGRASTMTTRTMTTRTKQKQATPQHAAQNPPKGFDALLFLNQNCWNPTTLLFHSQHNGMFTNFTAKISETTFCLWQKRPESLRIAWDTGPTCNVIPKTICHFQTVSSDCKRGPFCTISTAMLGWYLGDVWGQGKPTTVHSSVARRCL